MMDELIPLVNRLQQVFAPLGIPPIDLPQIAVVGSQSSGKSSVLESFVGRSLLPRGAGICTRRPLIMQLSHGEDEYCEFGHKPGVRFTNYDAVRKEIENETEREASGKAVSPVPIVLKVHAPHVVNLTLVDLPGLTKVPITGQPDDIVATINEMVRNAISRPNCIILAVSPANQDLATSDGLMFAREVDPSGERTVGVITKTDLAIEDMANQAADFVFGKLYSLRLGTVAVVNRSQVNSDKGETMEEARKKEELFFRRHAVFGSIADRLGTKYLAHMLNKVLEDHIRSCLPSITRSVKTQLQQAQKDVEECGEVIETEKEQRAAILRALTSFLQNFEDCMEGRGRNASEVGLVGGARIRHLFSIEFRDVLIAADPLAVLSDEEIMRVRKNVLGTKPDLFVPNSAFEVLLKTLILSLESPALACVRDAHEELRSIIMLVLDVTGPVRQFDALYQRMQEVCAAFLSECCETATDFVSSLVKMEVAYINTDHPDFENVRKGVYKLMAAGGDLHTADVHPQSSSSRDGTVAAIAPPAVMEGKVDYWNGSKFVKECHMRVSNGLLEIFPQSQGSPTSLAPLKSSPLLGASLKEASRPDSLEIELPANRSGWFSSNKDVVLVVVSDRLALWRTVILSAAGKSSSSSGAAGGGGFGGGAGGGRAVARASEKEMAEAVILRQLLKTYFDIVRRNVLDGVPKAIMLTLVNAVREGLQQELMTKVYMDETRLSQFAQQSEGMKARRRDAETRVKALRSALDILQHPPSHR